MPHNNILTRLLKKQQRCLALLPRSDTNFQKVGVYTRGEIFNDPTGFLGGKFTDKTGKQTGYKLWGLHLALNIKQVIILTFVLKEEPYSATAIKQFSGGIRKRKTHDWRQ